MPRLGVLVPSVNEAEDIIKNPRYRWEIAEAGLYESKAFPVSLEVSGVGKVFSAAGVARLSGAVDAVVALGTSGSLVLDPVGSLRVSFDFVERDMDAAALGFPRGITPYSEMPKAVIDSCPAALRNEILALLSAYGPEIAEARTASGDTFVASRANSAGVAAEFGATLVDMESAAAAKLCRYRYDLPFFALRWICDNADYDAGGTWTVLIREASRELDRLLLYLLDQGFVERLGKIDGGGAR